MEREGPFVKRNRNLVGFFYFDLILIVLYVSLYLVHVSDELQSCLLPCLVSSSPSTAVLYCKPLFEHRGHST